MKLNVEAVTRADRATAWSVYNRPEDITQWNSPAPEWHSPTSRVDLREGGTFNTRMEARDGSAGFDFEGTYTQVLPNELVAYRMTDGREASVRFSDAPEGTRVSVEFDAETENPNDVQQQGWQAILDNFARYADGKAVAK
jgi:uncharacterized protein YndB with AHSA1/START domain